MSAVLEEEVMEEARLGRLESDVAHIRSDISEVKADGRQMRSELGSLNSKVAALQDEMHVADEKLRHEIMRTALSLKLWMLSVAGTLLAVMAHGFKWL